MPEQEMGGNFTWLFYCTGIKLIQASDCRAVLIRNETVLAVIGLYIKRGEGKATSLIPSNEGTPRDTTVLADGQQGTRQQKNTSRAWFAQPVMVRLLAALLSTGGTSSEEGSAPEPSVTGGVSVDMPALRAHPAPEDPPPSPRDLSPAPSCP